MERQVKGCTYIVFYVRIIIKDVFSLQFGNGIWKWKFIKLIFSETLKIPFFRLRADGRAEAERRRIEFQA